MILTPYGVVILDIIMEGKVSQIFYLGPSSYLFDLENVFFFNFIKRFAIWGMK